MVYMLVCILRLVVVYGYVTTAHSTESMLQNWFSLLAIVCHLLDKTRKSLFEFPKRHAFSIPYFLPPSYPSFIPSFWT